jgi:hypothetical protein
MVLKLNRDICPWKEWIMSLERSKIRDNFIWAFSERALACNCKIVEFAFLNAGAALNQSLKLAGAKTPSEFVDVVTDNVREQFETLSEQVEELTAIAWNGLSKAEEPPFFE